MVAKLYSQIKKDGRAGRDADGDGQFDERNTGVTQEIKSYVKDTVRNDFSQLYSEKSQGDRNVTRSSMRRALRSAASSMGGLLDDDDKLSGVSPAATKKLVYRQIDAVLDENKNNLF